MVKKISFIQWFIRLVRRDMKEYEEDERTKQKIYDAIQSKLKE